MASHKSLSLFVFTIFALCLSLSSSMEFNVGGKEGWKIPSSPEESLNEWAEDNRFKIGDTLVLKYDNKNDSVLEVTKEDYEGCKTSDPIKEYNDGETHIELERTGPYYFISGANGNCEKGEKLVVVVLSTHDQKGDSSSIVPAAAMSPDFNEPEASSPEAVVAPQKGASYGLKIEYLNLLSFGFACLAGTGVAFF